MIPNPDNRPPLMQKLDGRWTATGDVTGEPAQYDVIVAPALQGQFTEISMNDVQAPSHCEARIFIGFDGESQQVIAHWMDNFGAADSIPHGTGSMAGNVIEFIVLYPQSAFKDRFDYFPESDSWALEITAQQPDGGWKHFARYDFRRVA